MPLEAVRETPLRLVERSFLYQVELRCALIEVIRQKMKDIDRKKAELDQAQTYLAHMLALKLAWSEAEENGTAYGNPCVIPGH